MLSIPTYTNPPQKIKATPRFVPPRSLPLWAYRLRRNQWCQQHAPRFEGERPRLLLSFQWFGFDTRLVQTLQPLKKRPGCVLYRHLNRNDGQWATSQTVKDKNHLHDSSLLDFVWGPPTNLHIPSKCANTKHLQHLLGLARVCHIARPGVHRWTVWSTCQRIKGLLQGGITRSHTTTAWNQNQMLGTHVHQFLTWIKLRQRWDTCTNLDVPGMKGWHLLWSCLNHYNLTT